jgi:hypothetical protein
MPYADAPAIRDLVDCLPVGLAVIAQELHHYREAKVAPLVGMSLTGLLEDYRLLLVKLFWQLLGVKSAAISRRPSFSVYS